MILDFLKISLVVSLAFADSTLGVFPAYASVVEVKREWEMDKDFTFRFYDVQKMDKRSTSFSGALREIYKIADASKREKTIVNDFTIRLENLEDDGQDAIVGELVRCQATNFPSEISANGTRKKLNIPRLGHSVVFRYDTKRSILGIQYDFKIISPGRFMDYMLAMNAQAAYDLQPKINKNSWAKFNKGKTRKLMIRIANPEELDNLDGGAEVAGTSISAMGDAYSAPNIYIEMSMGHNKGFLSNSVNALADQLSVLVGGARLDKLKAVTEVNDSREEIDLIEQRIVAKGNLLIDDRDADKNYEIKKKYLIQEMKKLV